MQNTRSSFRVRYEKTELKKHCRLVCTLVRVIRSGVSHRSRRCSRARPHCWQLDGELFLAPGFPVPPNMDYVSYHNYIDETLPPESPVLYGLHPNAEIEFLTTLSENLFRTVLEMQPRDAGAAGGSGVSREEKVRGPPLFVGH